MQWSAERPFGLLYLIELPVAAQFVVVLLLMDLSFYYWHVANHRIPVLWRFHNVHHIDPDLDVSTAFRFHFGEVALSAAFRAMQVTVIGLPHPASATAVLIVPHCCRVSRCTYPIEATTPRGSSR